MNSESRLWCEDIFDEFLDRTQDAASLWRYDAVNSPANGSRGRSDSLLLEDNEDLTGTGKKPRRKRATPITSNIKMKEAKTDERSFIVSKGKLHWELTQTHETWVKKAVREPPASGYKMPAW